MDQSFILDPRQQLTVAEVSEHSDIEYEIDDEIPPHVSIFQLPETITTNKPEAYKPQVVGFGPYHHGGSGVDTEKLQQKVVQLQRLLRDGEIDDFHGAVIDKVEQLVPVIQFCYETFPQDDVDSLAVVFAVDGLYLLDLLNTNVDPTLAQDIMMLENQIPFRVLKKIYHVLHPSVQYVFNPLSLSNFEHSPLTVCSPSIFRSFCENHSPLTICSPLNAPTHVEHLLHYMYFSIINYPSAMFEDYNNTSQVVEFPVNIEVPQREIKQTMPSASNLERAGFRFWYLPEEYGGIESIFLSIEEVKLHLPCVTLSDDSEVILRNLVAYETFRPHSGHHHLKEYMGLMCELIVNVEDVEVLKRENIIKGDLGDDEVANMFVRMSGVPAIKEIIYRSEGLQQLRDDANKVYESSPMIIRENWLMKTLANGCCLF